MYVPRIVVIKPTQCLVSFHMNNLFTIICISWKREITEQNHSEIIPYEKNQYT